MLILVGVSVSIILQSNLIGTAEKASQKTKNAYNEEGHVEDQIKVGDQDLGDYLAGIVSLNSMKGKKAR